MGDRSNSGVRNIRALFEAKTETTSPPSRGRSPAGSEGARSISSRPISRVRASFVAVERSGQVGLRKMSDPIEGVPGGVGATPQKAGTTSADQQVNGGAGSDSLVNGKPLAGLKEEDLMTSEKLANGHTEKGTTSAGPVLEKAPASLAAGTAAQTVIGDGKSQPELSVDTKAKLVSALENAPGDLGVVLKGSPFEAPESSGADRPTTQDTASSVKPSGSSGKDTTNLDKDKSKPAANGKPLLTTKSKPETEATASKPAPISTKSDSQKAQKSGPALSSAHTSKPAKPATPKTPTTPKLQPSSKTSSPRQPISKTSSPRQPVLENETGKEIKKDSERAPLRKASRTSLAPQASRAEPKVRQSIAGTAQSSKNAATSTSTKQPSSLATAPTASHAPKLTPSSPASAFTKPKPKSPTRPQRLPASVTAPTAASAAKLGGNPLSRSPSRASTAGTTLNRKPSTLKKDAAATHTRGPPSATTPGLKKKVSRPSLPAGPHPDRPKSRASTVGSKAPDEGFLARMMRPTASSASKMHEKIEPKSPPRKAAPIKPKRKSNGTDEGKSMLTSGEPAQAPWEPAPEEDGQIDDAGLEMVEEDKGTVDGAEPSADALAA
ncbi:hypothetical protein MMC30_002395 [Trapelia coarctata]|nr:hypothetical protein [Trapelia coarctata]